MYSAVDRGAIAVLGATGAAVRDVRREVEILSVRSEAQNLLPISNTPLAATGKSRPYFISVLLAKPQHLSSHGCGSHCRAGPSAQ